MDPFTHTLFGGVLAETGLKRRSAWAAAALVVGANLPDVDVVAYAWGADTALGFRRGWTHGVVAMAVLPGLLTLLILAGERWRRRRHAPGQAVDPLQLWLLSSIAVWSHPLLDWLNTYGVRVLMPFSGRWFYGDALFIIDPWMWLLLGGALFLCCSRSRRAVVAWAAFGGLLTAVVMVGAGPHGWARWLWLAALAGLAWLRLRGPRLSEHGRRGLARTALCAAALYAAGMAAATQWTTAEVESTLHEAGVDLAGPLMVGPDRIDPLKRLVVVPVAGAYRFGSFHPLRRPALRLEAERPVLAAPGLAPQEARELVEKARAAPCVHGLVTWLRYPFYEVDAQAAGEVEVYLLDARYTRQRTRGFGGGAVALSPDGGASCEARPR